MLNLKMSARSVGGQWIHFGMFTAGLLLTAVFWTQPALAETPCCTVTAVNAAAHVAVARDEASGRLFQFNLRSPSLLASLRPGQKIYANLGARQVSLDGKSIAGAILQISGQATRTLLPVTPGAGASPAGPAPLSPAPAAANRAPAVTAAPPAGRGLVPASYSLPQVSAGAPLPSRSAQPASGGRLSPGSMPAPRAVVGSNLVHLRGIQGIRQATGISDATKDFLLMHARALPPSEVDNYVVNPQAAEEWFRTHPEPEAVKKAAHQGDGHTGCNAISVHCAEEAGKHAEDEASRQSQKLLEAAQGEWNHVAHEAAHDWAMTEDCFADHTLHLGNVPVKFSILPQFPLPFGTSGKTGAASGSVQGTVTFGVPINADFTAQVDLFYIPCLPFAVRPRSLGADGALGVGSTFEASMTAAGEFDQTFTIPPGGGPHFPIEVIPIVIAGVPVAEMDVSIYLDGTVEVGGKGNLKGDVKMKAMETSAFDFQCDGKGCDLHQHTVALPETAAESVRIDGRVLVKPAVYAALQLDFDVDALSARAGPQPYLLGQLDGCSATTAAQTAGGPSSAQEQYGLAADLDWGVELRAEALVGPKKVGEKKWDLLSRHIAFQDLSHSLVPVLTSSGQPAAGQAAAYRINMPACYPYRDQMEYALRWTGGASASQGASSSAPVAKAGVALPRLSPASDSTQSSSPACNLGSGQGDCWGDPLKGISLDLAWPAAGNYTLSVVPVRDKHGRVFNSSAGLQQPVSVH